MAVSGQVLDEIRSRLDIVAVIGEHVQLLRAGRNFKGLCPFHSEKTPSFVVAPDRQRFHCFGCHKDGDIFAFVMEYERMEFTEAVELLAGRAGVEIVRDERGRAAPGTEEKGELKLIHQRAARLFQKWLQSGPGSDRARAYLAGRHLSPESVRDYGLGFAPDAWDSLVAAAGVAPPRLERAGLAVARPEGGHYDRFRNRLIFPILDARGEVVAFGGRTLGDDRAKYLNSPDTPIFHKGQTLYGLFQAREPIREARTAVVVEGYFDLLSLHDRGIRNVVAPLGTALTADHLRLLARLADRLILLFDGDQAGRDAAVRAITLGFENDLTDLEVVPLPAGQDPDDVVQREGPVRMRQRLEHPVAGLDFVVEETARQHDLARPSQVEACARKLVPLLARIPSRIKRGLYLDQLAARLGIADAGLLDELRRSVVRRPTRAARPAGSRPAPDRCGFDRDELRAMACLLHEPECIETAFARIRPDDFTDPRLRQVAEQLAEAARRGAGPDWEAAVAALADEADRELFRRLAFGDWLGLDTSGERTAPRLAGAIDRLLRRRIEREIRELQVRHAAAEKAGDADLAGRLAREIMDLKRALIAAPRPDPPLGPEL